MIFKQNWFAQNLTKKDGVFKAEVPGNLQYDYYRFKQWPDYQLGDNYKLFEQIEDDIWEYFSDLRFENHSDKKVFFCALGVDYRCEIRLNNILLLKHEGSFSRIELDLTEHLNEGDNRLSITVLPHPKRADAPFGRSQADICCKAPVCYGWGWHPRLIVSGLWQDAYIETRECGYISSPEVLYTLSDDLKCADITFNWNCDEAVTVSFFDKNGTLLYKGNDKKLHLENIELWWCNGQGEPVLYSWKMESSTDCKTGHTGFKKGRLVMNSGAWERPGNFPKSRSDAPATLELNGRKIFCQGTNFITPDIFTGRVTRDKYRRQIELARDAHMNIFRCWGGCGCQSEDFYDLCDELGIMVWVEFPLACNLYPENDEYLNILEQEATEILLRLRQHPSITIWCGGNELFNAWSGMTEQHLALRLLDSLCYKYDRARPFLMTSPLNGMGHGGYLFFDREQGIDNFSSFKINRHSCYTEFGPPALGDIDIIKKVIPESSRQFPIVSDNPDWVAHYGTQNDPWRCLADTLECFPECETLEEAAEYSDILQSMAYKAMFEEARRQWPECSMAINWCYNEPWYSLVNRNIITYDSKPLPSYYAIKDSLSPVLATAGIEKFVWKAEEIFSADIVLHNDTLEEIKRNITVKLSIGNEEYLLLDWSGNCASMANTLAPTVRFKLPDIKNASVFTLTLRTDDGIVNEYTLRYRAKSAPAKVRRLNE